MTVRTVVVVKHVVCQAAATCTECDRVLKDRRLYVRSAIARKGGRPLGFGVGRFCSVRCLLAFAAEREKEGQGTIRGWTFGDAQHLYESKAKATKKKTRKTRRKT